jgi:hypothetical protein
MDHYFESGYQQPNSYNNPSPKSWREAFQIFLIPNRSDLQVGTKYHRVLELRAVELEVTELHL